MSEIGLLHFFSMFEGITEQQTDAELLYLGVLLRIPKEEINTPAHYEKEDATMQRLPYLVKAEGFEPVPGGVIERYDAWDADSGDLLIMCRVPYRSDSAETSDDEQRAQADGLLGLKLKTPMDLVQAIKSGLPDKAAIDILIRMCQEAYVVGVETGRSEHEWDMFPLDPATAILH